MLRISLSLRSFVRGSDDCRVFLLGSKVSLLLLLWGTLDYLEVLDVIDFEDHTWLNRVMGRDFAEFRATAFGPKTAHFFQMH